MIGTISCNTDDDRKMEKGWLSWGIVPPVDTF